MRGYVAGMQGVIPSPGEECKVFWEFRVHKVSIILNSSTIKARRCDCKWQMQAENGNATQFHQRQINGWHSQLRHQPGATAHILHVNSVGERGRGFSPKKYLPDCIRKSGIFAVVRVWNKVHSTTPIHLHLYREFNSLRITFYAHKVWPSQKQLDIR
uniref:HDC14495 n=1 Tax=Drosophila melanogaster TaxID=7227 RepID=Q6IJP3_DROME|nr:TPA_inf: HDC14495 [Drosophila melanogaster]